MAKTQTKKLKTTTQSEPTDGETAPKIKKKIVKKKIKVLKKSKPPTNPSPSPSPSPEPSPPPTFEPEPDCDPADIPALLETCTREQLIDLISAAAADSPPLRAHIARVADLDVSRRKLFVHGLPWNASNEIVISEFRAFGEVEDCKVVTDKATGRAKGYAFIVFKTRRAAQEALRDPKRMVNNRLWSWQLATVGPGSSGANPAPLPAPARAALPVPAPALAVGGAQEGGEDVGARKIYVSNVGKTVEKERLRGFFSRFGELEAGPLGFDPLTGKSRGYALFVYRTVEGARKVLEEPYKVFEGQQLHCSIAKEGTSKSVGGGLKPQAENQQLGKQQQQQQQASLQPQPAQQGQMLAAMAAAQNLAMFGRHPGLNPVYSGLMGNSVSGAGGSSSAIINPLAGYSQGLMGSSQVGALGLGSQNLLGGYRFGQSLQSVYNYPSMQLGQPPTDRGSGTGFSFPEYPSHVWYGSLLLDFYHRLLDSLCAVIFGLLSFCAFLVILMVAVGLISLVSEAYTSLSKSQ